MKLSILVLALASACSSINVDVGSAGIDAGTGDPPSFYPAYTQNCGVQDGPVHSYSGVEAASQLLTATTWILCSGFTLDGSTQAGIVFGTDMIFHDMENEGSGALVELAGTSTNTWALDQGSPDVVLRVTTEFSGNQLDEVWSLTFEDAPRKLLVMLAGQSTPSARRVLGPGDA